MNDTINGDFELFQPDPQDFHTELRRTEAPTEVPFVLPIPISRTEAPTEDPFVLPELPEYHWDEPAEEPATHEYSSHDFEHDQMLNFDSHDGPTIISSSSSSSGGFPFGGFVQIAAVSILGSAILFLVVSCVRRHKHPDERRNSRNIRRRSLPWGHDSAHAPNSTAMAHAYVVDSTAPMATAVAIDSGGAGGFSGGGFSGGGDCGGGGGF